MKKHLADNTRNFTVCGITINPEMGRRMKTKNWTTHVNLVTCSNCLRFSKQKINP
ncbi:MAG: hypothetical protein ACXVNR_07550 [Bacteroidia bacterium]